LELRPATARCNKKGRPLKSLLFYFLPLLQRKATSAFVASDFEANTSGSHTYRSTPALVSGWYDIDLTTIKNHINKGSTLSGLTQIRLQFYMADNGNKKANYLQLYGGSSAYRPQLVIEYH